jgi:predicted esterase
MRLNWKIAAMAGVSALLSLLVGLAQTPAPQGGQNGPGAGPGARGFVNMDPIDSRVQVRSYLFTDTGETLPYAVFVPSSYSKDKKTPMVLALHGMNGSHATFMRSACVDEADKSGFILVGPMGYSSTGSFGMQFAGRGGRGPGGPGGREGTPAAANAPAPQAQPSAQAGPGRDGQPGRGGRGMGMREPGGTKETDRAKVAELSEKDAMNILAMIRQEFNIDDNRIYLMGHSLGGGGALHMGEKYSTIWAGVAGIAPAAFGFQWTADSKLKNVPLLIIQGDADTMVRPASSQQAAEELKALQFQSEYKLLAGLDHGGIIAGSMPDVFRFFVAHVKQKSK